MQDRTATAQSPAAAGPAAGLGDHAWLDPRRFAQRRFLQSVDRGHRPQRATPDAAAWLTADLARRWADLLRRDGQPIDPRDVVLCASEAELWHAGLALLLAPGDAVILAEPVPLAALRAVMQAGAAWIDVGRTASGDPDALALARAAAAHPQAIAFAQAPQPLGDAAAPLPTGLRATVVDLQRAAWPSELPAATAVLLALRDPLTPTEPLAWAVVTAPGQGQGLALLLGDAQLPRAQAEKARAVLQLWQTQPQALAASIAELEEKAQRLTAWTGQWPGLRDAGRRGLLWTAVCQAGDAAQLHQRLAGRAAEMRAYAHHPGHNLLVVDLLGEVAPRQPGDELVPAATSAPQR